MASQATSRLAQMQMRFQQKQQQEREQRRIEMTGGMGASSETNVTAKASIGNGKVRQMFDDRRRGIDRSHPLKPLTTTTTPKASISTTDLNASTNGRRKAGGAAMAPVKRGTTRSMTRSETYHFQSTNNGNYLNSNEHNFDELDNLDNESLPYEFNALNLGDTRIGDRNNNLHHKLMHEPTAAMKVRTRSSNSMKLNPVQVKKSPQITVATNYYNGNSRGSLNSSGNASVQRQAVQAKATPQRLSAERKSADKAASHRVTKPPPSRSSAGTPKMAAQSRTGSRNNSSTSAAAPSGAAPAGMAKCHYCYRNFNQDRVAKHEMVCQKMINTKRKVFDASKARVAGTEAEKFVAKKPATRAGANRITSNHSNHTATSGASNAQPKRSNWRKKHEEFIEAIRAAKKVQAHLARGGKLSDLPPPPPSDTSDYIQCPHCMRRFNQTAAERHIPKCATMLHNKTKPPAKRR